jgi:hypothetical protein
MDPQSIADFILGRGYYQSFEGRERFITNNLIPFFEVSEISVLTFDVSAINQKKECPIYYYDKNIAQSLIQFLHKMDEMDDYYLK